MGDTVSMIGLRKEELRWVRLLIRLLRDNDPGVAELTRQALLYLSDPDRLTAAPLQSGRPAIDQFQRKERHVGPPQCGTV